MPETEAIISSLTKCKNEQAIQRAKLQKEADAKGTKIMFVSGFDESVYDSAIRTMRMYKYKLLIDKG